jgi:hypothetical protein
LLTLELEFLIKSDAEPTVAAYSERFPDYLDGISAVFASFGLLRQTIEDRELRAALAQAKIAPAAIDALRSDGYEVRGELGRGGRGVVYLAWNLGLNRPCALKMILAGPHAGSVAAEPPGGAVEQIRLRVESLAGMKLDSSGVVSALGPEDIRQRLKKLEDSGGPPPLH